METKFLHIFENTPAGRETLLQSIDFCKKVQAALVIYIPRHIKFLMYFDNDVIQIDLDETYLSYPDTALSHAAELCRHVGIKAIYYEPKQFTSASLPDISTDFDYMCCPRTISKLSSKIGLGYIGPRVRRILNSAKFPVLIPCPVFKEWRYIAVFFGGSANALRSLKLGFRISSASGLPLTLFTYAEKSDKQRYEDLIRQEQLDNHVRLLVDQWHFFETGSFEENLYNVPHDALVIVGASGHGLLKEFMFDSKMEIIQSILPNNLLIVGPKYKAAAS